MVKVRGQKFHTWDNYLSKDVQVVPKYLWLDTEFCLLENSSFNDITTSTGRENKNIYLIPSDVFFLNLKFYGEGTLSHGQHYIDQEFFDYFKTPSIYLFHETKKRKHYCE